MTRQTGKLKLQFLTPAEANSVSEALKAICARAGFVPPPNDKGGMEARRALLAALWRRLADLGEVRINTALALDSWVEKRCLKFRGGVVNLDVRQLDDCARALGRWVCMAKAKPSQRGEQA